MNALSCFQDSERIKQACFHAPQLVWRGLRVIASSRAGNSIWIYHSSAGVRYVGYAFLPFVLVITVDLLISTGSKNVASQSIDESHARKLPQPFTALVPKPSVSHIVFEVLPQGQAHFN